MSASSSASGTVSISIRSFSSGLGLGVVEAGRQVDPDPLVGEPDRREVRPLHELPVARRLADLLGELALGAVERVLALHVELAGRQLEHLLLVDGLARLADEVHPLAVVGDHRDRARVADVLALGLLAVVVAEGVAVDRHDLAAVDDVARDPLEPHAGIPTRSPPPAPARPRARPGRTSGPPPADRPIVVAGSPLSR